MTRYRTVGAEVEVSLFTDFRDNVVSSFKGFIYGIMHREFLILSPIDRWFDILTGDFRSCPAAKQTRVCRCVFARFIEHEEGRGDIGRIPTTPWYGTKPSDWTWHVNGVIPISITPSDHIQSYVISMHYGLSLLFKSCSNYASKIAIKRGTIIPLRLSPIVFEMSLFNFGVTACLNVLFERVLIEYAPYLDGNTSLFNVARRFYSSNVRKSFKKWKSFAFLILCTLCVTMIMLRQNDKTAIAKYRIEYMKYVLDAILLIFRYFRKSSVNFENSSLLRVKKKTNVSRESAPLLP